MPKWIVWKDPDRHEVVADKIEFHGDTRGPERLLIFKTKDELVAAFAPGCWGRVESTGVSS
jgi:hypothetical protein